MIISFVIVIAVAIVAFIVFRRLHVKCLQITMLYAQKATTTKKAVVQHPTATELRSHRLCSKELQRKSVINIKTPTQFYLYCSSKSGNLAYKISVLLFVHCTINCLAQTYAYANVQCVERQLVYVNQYVCIVKITILQSTKVNTFPAHFSMRVAKRERKNCVVTTNTLLHHIISNTRELNK